MMSHDAEESENSPESPHLGEIKCMRKQCVPGASSFFARAGDEANTIPYTHHTVQFYMEESDIEIMIH